MTQAEQALLRQQHVVFVHPAVQVDVDHVVAGDPRAGAGVARVDGAHAQGEYLGYLEAGRACTDSL